LAFVVVISAVLIGMLQCTMVLPNCQAALLIKSECVAA